MNLTTTSEIKGDAMRHVARIFTGQGTAVNPERYDANRHGNPTWLFVREDGWVAMASDAHYHDAEQAWDWQHIIKL